MKIKSLPFDKGKKDHWSKGYLNSEDVASKTARIYSLTKPLCTEEKRPTAALQLSSTFSTVHWEPTQSQHATP